MENTNNITRAIVIAMLSGIAVGLVINFGFSPTSTVTTVVVGGVFATVGSLFISALKMLVVPLVFVSLVSGVTGLKDVAALGRIGIKSLLLYLTTTAVAITIALVVALIVAPGSGVSMDTANVEFSATTPPPISDVIMNLVPSNPIQAMASGNMLQVIVFAILFGVAITLSGEKGKHVLNFFKDLDVVILKMVDIVILVAPYGIFCLIAKTFATHGVEVIGPLAGYFFTVVLALLLHLSGTFSLLLILVAKLNPIIFIRKMRPVLMFAFSTASSNATIPINLETAEKKLGVDNSVASFTVPLGATINMDGTAIMQGVATVFIANVYGVDLGVSEYLTVILTATLASIGTAGVPGVGLIMLAMVLGQVGLPVEGIALIIGVDRLLDMMRTAVNVTGDAAVTCAIARTESSIDDNVYRN